MRYGNNLTTQERQLLARVDEALASGIELKDWWLRIDASGNYPNPYPESFVVNRPDDKSFGFLGVAPLSTGPLPVNGNVQHAFYDQPKAPRIPPANEAATAWIQKQIREFVLHYFLRISDFRQPQPFPETHRRPVLPFLEYFSWCPKDDPVVEGFGFLQLFYKKWNGEIAAFPLEEQSAIVDVRRLDDEFEWIVMKNPIFNFNLVFKPLGNSGPQIVIPFPASNFVILSRHFVVDEENPEPGMIGRYGVGYAFLRDPPGTSIVAYGPGQLEPAFEQLNWEVMENGEVFTRFAFVANQPERILDISLDPFDWAFMAADVLSMGVASRFYRPVQEAMAAALPELRIGPIFAALDLLNLVTAGQAGEQLCISGLQLKKEFLFIHFIQHYQTAVGSLQTWRQIPDWLDRAALPPFVTTGISSTLPPVVERNREEVRRELTR